MATSRLGLAWFLVIVVGASVVWLAQRGDATTTVITATSSSRPATALAPDAAAATAAARIGGAATAHALAPAAATGTAVPSLAALPDRHLGIGLTRAEWEQIYGSA